MILGISNFADRICEAVRGKKSVLCCGLDPQLRYMPPHLVREAVERYGRTLEAISWLFLAFNRQIIDSVHEVVVCVKPQMAFYEAYGAPGVLAFERTVEYARDMGLQVIGDLKRGDGGDTADAYADGHLGQVPFFGEGEDPTVELTRFVVPGNLDCMTIHGYIGEDCVGRFIKVVKEHGTGIFVVTKTSFKPNSLIEQLIVHMVDCSPRPVWQHLAMMVQQWGEGTEGNSGLRNVGVVMGATYSQDAPAMRAILPNSIFLIPGFGRQGGGADAAVVGIREDGFGGLVNNSRGLIYAWQKGDYQCEPEKFADAARKQAIDDRDALIAACQKAGKWPHGVYSQDRREGN